MTPSQSPEANSEFEALGLDPRLVKTLSALGYEEPTPIQQQAIPPLLAGKDLLGLAATGTGKTAAFALPILQGIDTGGKTPAALILVPTRELAMQVAQAVHRYGKELGVEVLPLYGGQAFGQQLKVLKRGVNVVVGTPGRVLDHIGRGTLVLDGVGIVVLDEADEMLDMGFSEDLDAILAAVPEERQTVLFSATMARQIEAIARRHLTDPVEIRIVGADLPEEEAPKVQQMAYVVRRSHKLAALGRILDLESPEAAIVFCRTRNEVDELTEALNGRGYRAEALHGGMSQEERDRVMKKLRTGSAELLIATDVAARGIDVAHLTHVINYEVPSAAKAYVHRIGRVGRAGREGVAITLSDPREHQQLRNIERLTKQKVKVARIPTVADLHARRLELLRASLRETLLGDDFHRFRVVVESLSDEFDVVDIAMGALMLAQEASGGDSPEEMEEIPDATLWEQKPAAKGHGKGSASGKDRPTQRGGRKPGASGGSGAGTTRIFIRAGRSDGIRPQDLVGAIVGESGIPARQVGEIQITDRFSLVEVPDTEVDRVVDALRGSGVRGKKVTIRPERPR